MIVVYPVIFTATQDEKDTCLVYIPDIDGTTEGYGLQDAIRMARDYLGCRFYDQPDDAIPPASNVEEIDVVQSEFATEGTSFVSLVDLDLSVYRRKMGKAVRRNVSVPGYRLNRILKMAATLLKKSCQDSSEGKGIFRRSWRRR